MSSNIIRNIFRLPSLAAIIVLGAGMFVSGISSVQAEPALIGTVLPNSPLAPQFSLVDQQNRQYALSSSLGKVVVLTVMYTHCTDVCPFIASKLKDAADLLGTDGNKVDFVVITADPERDTPDLLSAYSKEFGMLDRWHFVTGSLQQLTPLWRAYNVEVTVDKDQIATYDSAEVADLESKGLNNGMTSADVNHALKVINLFGGGYDVDHGTPIIFIDLTGHIRVITDENVSPSDIVANARALLAAGM